MLTAALCLAQLSVLGSILLAKCFAFNSKLALMIQYHVINYAKSIIVADIDKL